jgi:hypothetical protein
MMTTSTSIDAERATVRRQGEVPPQDRHSAGLAEQMKADNAAIEMDAKEGGAS